MQGEENFNPQFIDKYRRLADNVFSKKKVEWTVSTFQPYKSPDRDGISGPASTVFTIFFPFIGLVQGQLYTRACTYSLEESLVVFIPKAGRHSSIQPRSYYNLFCLQRWRKLCDATTFHNALLHHGKHPDVGYENFTSTAKAFS